MTPEDVRCDSRSSTSELPLLSFRETPRSCSYLPHETAALEYRYFHFLSAEAYRRFLERGWRRFGRVVFRPQCPTCRSCRSLRVAVDRFTPSKSQRRAVARNSGITVRFQRVTATQAHVDLFNAYHREMHSRKDWPTHVVTLAEYQAEFADPTVSFAWETLYFQNNQLVGVGLVDVLPQALSSVYFFHDPGWRSLGPGTFSVLREIAWARELATPYLYLGYWIEQCPSMSYKSRFVPHELVAQGVDFGETPVWITATACGGTDHPAQSGDSA